MDGAPPPKFVLYRVSGAPVSDSELLDDLRDVAKKLNQNTVGLKAYRERGKFDDSTIVRRFGSWNAGLIAAGLTISNEVEIPIERLFENILTLWQHYGRQPRRRELAFPPSTISQSPYNRRFGSWSAALEAFIKFANETGAVAPNNKESAKVAGATPREPSLRLRWRVLQRDHFACRACGRSPATTVEVKLHVDHIIAWSKGGETVVENLQTLCSECNAGKSDL